MIKRLIASLLVGVLLLSVAAPALAQAQPDPVAIVNTGTLNVRSGPGLGYGAIATLPQGFGVQLLARNAESNWVFIGLTNGVTGWVNVNYLYTRYRVRDLPVNNVAPASPLVPTARVNGIFALNVHTSPDPASAVIAVLGLDQTVDLTGRNFDASWAQIRLPNGVLGWVLAANVIGSVPVRSLSPADGSVWAPPPPSAPPGPRIHVVLRGEILSTIAQRYGVNVYTLAAANGITNINRIYAGQRLVIP
jgi:uncharacterized protein YraI